MLTQEFQNRSFVHAHTDVLVWFPSNSLFHVRAIDTIVS